MAGALLPTWVVLAGLIVFATARYGCGADFAIERMLIFPLAVVPNLWGLWNALYALRTHRHLSLGAHGALLPFLLAPAGLVLANAIEVPFVTGRFVLTGLPVAVAIYYLAWKHVVGFFNRVVQL
jgi:hypothetical protein